MGPEGGGAAGWEAVASAGSWVTLSREATGGLHAGALQDLICPRGTLAVLGRRVDLRGLQRASRQERRWTGSSPDLFPPSEIRSPAVTWPGGCWVHRGPSFFYMSGGQEKEEK